MEETNKPDYVGDLFLIANQPYGKKIINYGGCSLEMFIDEEIPIICKPNHAIDRKKYVYDCIQNINYEITNEENCEIKGRIIMGETIKTPLINRKRDENRIESIKDEWEFNGIKLYDKTDKYYNIYLEECHNKNTRIIVANSKILKISINDSNKNNYLYCDFFQGTLETELTEEDLPSNMRKIYFPVTDYFLKIRSLLRTTKYKTIEI